MKTKVITGFCIFLGIIAMVASRLLTRYIFDACFVIISCCASFEIAKCLNLKGKNVFEYFSLVYPVSIYAVFLIGFLNNLSWWWILIFEIWLLVLVFCVLAIVCAVQKKKISSAFWTLFTFIYPAYLLMFFYLVNHSPSLFRAGVDIGLLGCVLVLGISPVVDTAAMFTGMLLKGPKLCPKVSPKKTISGFLGGLVFGTLAGMLIFAIFNAFSNFSNLFILSGVKLWHFAIIGFVGALLTQLGDLTESLFKRKVGVKDTANVFPGHGGFMDRVDGWCFNVVAVFMFLFILFI